MSLTDGLEAYICIILTIEFWYDMWYNTRENRIKRRKKLEKTKDTRNEVKIGHPVNLEQKQGTEDYIK